MFTLLHTIRLTSSFLTPWLYPTYMFTLQHTWLYPTYLFPVLHLWQYPTYQFTLTHLTISDLHVYSLAQWTLSNFSVYSLTRWTISDLMFLSHAIDYIRLTCLQYSPTHVTISYLCFYSHLHLTIPKLHVYSLKQWLSSAYMFILLHKELHLTLKFTVLSKTFSYPEL